MTAFYDTRLNGWRKYLCLPVAVLLFLLPASGFSQLSGLYIVETGSDGGFHFDSIPTGHYSFYADFKGWPMDAANDSLLIDQENHSYVLSAIASESGITLTVSDVTAVNDLPNGIYFISISGSHCSYKARFIKLQDQLENS